MKKTNFGTRLLSLALSASLVLLMLPAMTVEAESAELTEAEKRKVHTSVSQLTSGDYWEWNRVIGTNNLPTSLDGKWHQALIMFQVGIPTNGMDYPNNKYYLSGDSVVSYHTGRPDKCTYFDSNNSFANDPNMTMQDKFFTQSDLKAYYIQFAGYDPEFLDESPAEYMPRYHIQLADKDGKPSGKYIGVKDAPYGSGSYRFLNIVENINYAAPLTFYVGGANNTKGPEYRGQVYIFQSVDNDVDYAFQDAHYYGDLYNSGDKVYYPKTAGRIGIDTRQVAVYPWSSIAHMSVYMAKKHTMNLYTDMIVSAGTTRNIADNSAIPENCKIVVEEGGTLGISGKVFLDGIIENHGTVVLNNDAMVVPTQHYASPGKATIICDGGKLVVMEEATLYIPEDTALILKNGSFVENLGGIVVAHGIRMENSIINNRETGVLDIGFRLSVSLGSIEKRSFKRYVDTNDKTVKKGYWASLDEVGATDFGRDLYESTSTWTQLGAGAKIVNNGRLEINTALYVKEPDNWYSGEGECYFYLLREEITSIFIKSNTQISGEGVRNVLTAAMGSDDKPYIIPWTYDRWKGKWSIETLEETLADTWWGYAARKWTVDSNGLKNTDY